MLRVWHMKFYIYMFYTIYVTYKYIRYDIVCLISLLFGIRKLVYVVVLMTLRSTTGLSYFFPFL